MPADQSSPIRRTVLRSLGAIGAIGATGIGVGTTVAQRGQYEPLGSVDIPGTVAEAVASEDGRTAYVAIDQGFVSVDVSNPSSPTVLARRTDTGLSGVLDVKEEGDRVIVVGPGNSTGRVNGMGLYDVSNPANPELLAFHDTNFSIHNAYLTEDVAYLINNEGAEMVMIDVSNDDPTEIGRWSLSGGSILHDLWVQDGVAYLNYWNDGTPMVDVSDPRNPSMIGKVRDGSPRSGNNDHYVTVNEDASIVAIGKEQLGSTNLGVELWDISDKRDTEFLAEVQPPSEPAGGERTSHNLDIENGYMYTSWYDGGIMVHDISDPANPREVASWRGDASFWTAEVAEAGSTVIASDTALIGGGGGLYTFPDPAEVGEQPPTARIDAPDRVSVDEPAAFDGTGSSDPDGRIVDYEWDFGDGTTAGGAEVTHAYDAAGTYEVTLRVVDDDGNADTATASVTASEEVPVSVRTGEATDVSDSSATLNGTLEEIGISDSARVSFEWGPSGSDLPNETDPQTLSSTGSFSESIFGLDSETTYEFRAVAEGDDGSADEGGVESFTTDQSFCFITTATAREPETLNSLRRFRDESMGATPVGRGLAGLYYRVSPPIAETLDRHPESRTADATRRIVESCASLSDRQDETDSRLESALLGVALTKLYVLGVLVAAGGHAGIRATEVADELID